ncbi:MAG: hypothetical protein AAF532_11420 [Planctomycetota bacterium]
MSEPIDRSTLLQQLQVFRESLSSASQSQNPIVPHHLASQFNKLRAGVAATVPELASLIPDEVSLDGVFGGMGVTSLHYTDIVVLCDQMIEMIEAGPDE